MSFRPFSRLPELRRRRQSTASRKKPIEGVSMGYTFDKANADAASKRDTQYFEMVGNRAIYHDGWIAATTPPAAPWLLAAGKLPDLETGDRCSAIRTGCASTRS